MSAGYKIKWSARAADDFEQIIRYLSENWNEREIRKFVRQIDKNITYIQTSPLTFPATFHYPGLRRCVISKIHTLYYLVQNRTIYLIRIWDNRRDARKLKDFLK